MTRTKMVQIVAEGGPERANVPYDVVRRYRSTPDTLRTRLGKTFQIAFIISSLEILFLFCVAIAKTER
jgi:hypothetical protein